MFRCLNLLLLLFGFIKNSGSPAVGSNLLHVTEKTGESVTLSCESEDREITAVDLSRLSKNILVCEKEECKSGNSRVFKEGSCDVVIKDLKLSDAGKYILYVYYTNDQTEVKREIRKYQLHIHDEISVKKGEQLKLDVLLISAYKVERNSSEGWTEVWTRGHGVNSDRLTDRDGNLIINEFTANDTGTYRVLDYNNETLITVSVTESGSGSKENLNTDDNKHKEQHKYLIIGLSVSGALLALALVCVIVFVIRKYQCLNRRYLQPPDKYAEESGL